nr:MAG TPA: hypothetical protein [Caudoviricetes sp.]
MLLVITGNKIGLIHGKPKSFFDMAIMSEVSNESSETCND